MLRSYSAALQLVGRVSFFVVLVSAWEWGPRDVMAEAVMPCDPTFAWAFDEGDGTTLGPLFGIQSGTLKKGTTWSTETPFSYGDNYSTHFPANTDYVAFPTHTTVPAGSLQFWVYTTDMGGGDYYMHTSGAGRLYLWVFTSNPSSAGLGLNGVAGVGSFAKPDDNIWNHLVITWDASLTSDNVKAYVTNENGQSVYTMTKTLNWGDDTGNIYLGSASNDYGYVGFLDEVAFWDVSLSADNVDWLYENSITRIPEPSAALLAGLGVLGLLFARSRRGRRCP